MPTSGVEAWLADSGARVVVDRRALLRLSEARISVRVIDLMVALAYPTRFEVHRATMAGSSSGVWSGVMLQPLHGGDDLADLYGFGFGALGMPFFSTTSYNDPGWIMTCLVGWGRSGGGTATRTGGQRPGLYAGGAPRAYRAGGARPGSSQAATSGGDGAGGSSSSGDSGS